MNMKVVGCLMMVGAMGIASAEVVTLENELATMKLDEKGQLTSLVVKADGKEILAGPATFCWTGDEKYVQPERMEARGNDEYAWIFPERHGGGEVVMKITSFGPGWTYEIRQCTVPSANNLYFGRAKVKCTKYNGYIANMYSDDDHCAVLRGYNAKCRMSAHGELRLNVEKRHGFEGTRGGLVVARRQDTLKALKAMTREAGVFTTINGGPNSLGSEANRGSYCFADLGANTVEDWIDFALRGGVDTIHIHGWWETRGSYPFRKKYFPNGDEDWVRVCNQIHDAGLKVGIHTLSYNIQPRDQLITPECKGPLMEWCTVTLAKELRPEDKEMLVEEPINQEKFHTFHAYGSKGNTFRIGGELIQYSKVDSERRAFMNVKRGAWNTKVGETLPAGTKLHYLYQRYDAFFAEPESDFGEEVGKAIARVCKLGKVDQIYLDGAEAIREDRNYANDRLREHILKYLDSKMLIEGSNGDAFTWWYLSRYGAWDRPFWAMKRMHDDHLADVERARTRNFLEAQMGWWSPQIGNTEYPPHKIDDMEYFAARNTAVDTSMSVQDMFVTSPGPLQFTIMQQMTVLGWYERFRMARAFTEGAMAKLKQPRQETKLRQSQYYGWQLWSNDEYFHRAVPENAANKWQWDIVKAPNESMIRVEALYYPDENSTNQVVLIDKGVVTHTNIEKKVEWPLQPYKNCKGCYAISIDVKGDGSGADAWIILETPNLYGWGKSHHLVKLDFTGWRHFTFVLRERDTAEAYNLKWNGENYIHPMVCCATKLNMEHIISAKVILNNIPEGREVRAEFKNLKAIPSVSKKVKRSALRFDDRMIKIPFVMTSGDFAELENEEWRLYNQGGNLIERAPGPKVLLPVGKTTVAYGGELEDGTKAARAEVAYFAAHSPVKAIRDVKDMDEKTRKAIAYEAVMPSRYCPRNGLNKLEQVIVRIGEKAALETTIFGEVDHPTFRFCGEEWTFPVKIERLQRLYCKNGRDWRLVDGERKLLASGTLEKPLPVLESGLNELGFSSADEKRADCRVDLVKHYTDQPSYFEEHKLVVKSSLDGSEQPSYFFPAPAKDGVKSPLLVVFHTWSYNMWEQTYAVYSGTISECRKLGWSVLCPNFRGPNNTPQGCGSDLATGDVKDAIDYVKANYAIDDDRVYAMGGSGGGHMTLLLAGRFPEIWAGCAAFCPPADLVKWHPRSKALGHCYWQHLEAACGGTPEERRTEYEHRSPASYGAIIREKGVNVMLITGVHDGIKGKGSVPVSIVTGMFNSMVDAKDRLDVDFMRYVDEREAVPKEYRFKGKDPFYGVNNPVLFRRTSGNVQYTIFEGAHGGNGAAAMDWLKRQRRGQKADFSLPITGTTEIKAFTK